MRKYHILKHHNIPFGDVRVAVCGELPTACEYLLRLGVTKIDKYAYATELTDEASYHLILIYAPHAEGILDTVYHAGSKKIPIRLLNEPCCHSALLELKSMLRRICAAAPPEREVVMNE